MGKIRSVLKIILECIIFFFNFFFFWLTWFEVSKIRQEPKMKEIAIFTLVIWCIEVESLPGALEKRQTTGETTGETTDCSFLLTDALIPSRKRYHVFVGTEGEIYGIGWQESLEACRTMGGNLAQPSTPEEQDKILAAIRKFPPSKTDPFSYNEDTCYWIGLHKAADAFWVSGEELALDSGLNFINADKWDNNGNKDICGAIDNQGIRDFECDYPMHGYVCEFHHASPICIQ